MLPSCYERRLAIVRAAIRAMGIEDEQLLQDCTQAAMERLVRAERSGKPPQSVTGLGRLARWAALNELGRREPPTSSIDDAREQVQPDFSDEAIERLDAADTVASLPWHELTRRQRELALLLSAGAQLSDIRIAWGVSKAYVYQLRDSMGRRLFTDPGEGGSIS